MYIKLDIPEQFKTTHITIGADRDLIAELPSFERCAVVIDASLDIVHQNKIRKGLQQLHPIWISVPAGEAAKTREVKAHIEDTLLQNSCGKDTWLFAVGGGATLDVAGFAASTFCRGLPLVFIPTTLLAMVDAAIGGKNAVNIDGVKNCIGTTYHPNHVCVDIDFLMTLPDYAMRCGLVEAMKHAFLTSQDAVDKLCKQIPYIMQRQKRALLEMIAENISFKSDIVRKATANSHIRDLLNFGHTFGHAIEFLQSHRIEHGVAVARGIVAESFIAHNRGLLAQHDFLKIYNSLHMLHLPLQQAEHYPYELWKKAFLVDKKTKNSIPCAVILQAIGSPWHTDGSYAHPLREEEIKQAIRRIEECPS